VSAGAAQKINLDLAEIIHASRPHVQNRNGHRKALTCCGGLTRKALLYCQSEPIAQRPANYQIPAHKTSYLKSSSGLHRVWMDYRVHMYLVVSSARRSTSIQAKPVHPKKKFTHKRSRLCGCRRWTAIILGSI
jgi:hypothetical protein